MTVETLTFTKTHNERGIRTNLPFWVTPAEVTAHIKATYIDTGKMTETTVLSEDGATRNVTQTFVDEEAKTQWKTDPILLENAANRKAFNAANDIVEVLA
jgi:hypothetical protein